MFSFPRSLSLLWQPVILVGLAFAPLAVCQVTPAAAPPDTPATPTTSPAPQRVRPARIPRPGVATPGISRPMSDIVTTAVVPVEGSPDWAGIAKDAIWITSARVNHVVQILAATNQVGLTVDIQRPCSGLTDAFGSIWIPSCGDHTIVRVDDTTGKTIATIPADPANSEGGITNGAGSIWMVTKPSTLVRVDPKTNAVIKSIDLPAGSENPLYSEGFVWVSSTNDPGMLLKIDPKSDSVVASIPVGPKPRFLTASPGSIWTLNQGDGTVSRVDIKTGAMIATIPCGIPGSGGEIAFGAGSIWPTNRDFPITQIDVSTNKVVKQWGGPGGDGIKFGFGSVWLSNGSLQTVWRISPDQK